MAYDQMSHWRDSNKKIAPKRGMVRYHPLVGDMADILLDRTQRLMHTCSIVSQWHSYFSAAFCNATRFKTSSSLAASRCRTSSSLSDKVKFLRFCPTKALSVPDMTVTADGNAFDRSSTVGVGKTSNFCCDGTKFLDVG